MLYSNADQTIENLVMRNVLNFIASIDVRYIMDNKLVNCCRTVRVIVWNCKLFFPWWYILFYFSPNTYFLHLELLNFMIIAISTQLLCGPSPGPNDVNPFLDAAMAQVRSWNLNLELRLFSWAVLQRANFKLVHCNLLQDSHLVTSVVCNLLLNYITRPRVPFNRASYSIFYDRSQNSVLKRVGSAAGMVTNYSILFMNFWGQTYFVIYKVLW